LFYEEVPAIARYIDKRFINHRKAKQANTHSPDYKAGQRAKQGEND